MLVKICGIRGLRELEMKMIRNFVEICNAR